MGYLITVYHSQANKGKNAEFRCQQFVGFRIYAPLFYQQFIKGGNKVRKQFQEGLVELIIEFIPLVTDELFGFDGFEQVLDT